MDAATFSTLCELREYLDRPHINNHKACERVEELLSRGYIVEYQGSTLYGYVVKDEGVYHSKIHRLRKADDGSGNLIMEKGFEIVSNNTLDVLVALIKARDK